MNYENHKAPYRRDLDHQGTSGHLRGPQGCVREPWENLTEVRVESQKVRQRTRRVKLRENLTEEIQESQNVRHRVEVHIKWGNFNGSTSRISESEAKN